jgi:hypothetical protein
MYDLLLTKKKNTFFSFFAFVRGDCAVQCIKHVEKRSGIDETREVFLECLCVCVSIREREKSKGGTCTHTHTQNGELNKEETRIGVYIYNICMSKSERRRAEPLLLCLSVPMCCFASAPLR